MTYDSALAAQYLLALAYEKKIVLNVTKVQKLLFMAYGDYLAKKNEKLVDEEPKAWPYGPVFPNTRRKVDFSKIIPLDDPCFGDIKEDNEVTELFNLIIDKYSGFSASKLSDWSHMKDSPWDRTMKQPGFEWNHPIKDEFIADYFQKNHV